MMSRLLLAVLLLLPGALFAQKREIQELQRDMALLQDEVRMMNQKLASLTVMVEQVLDRVNNTNTEVTVLDSSLKDTLKEQEKSIAAPVAALGAKVDRMSDEFRFVRESVADLGARLGKLQTQVSDLRSAMQVMSAPPPPPGASGAPAATSAEALFDNARRDQSGGKMDLALAQYQDFLNYFPNSDLAPAAQYSIGEIHYGKGDYKSALEAFDLVLEKYPENEKTPDAMYMKGMSLLNSGQKRAAAREFRALVGKYPEGELAAKARGELKKLGN